MELAVGLEPTTCGLRNRCSTTELRQHAGVELYRTCSTRFNSLIRFSNSAVRSDGRMTHFRITPGSVTRSASSAAGQAPLEFQQSASYPAARRFVLKNREAQDGALVKHHGSEPTLSPTLPEPSKDYVIGSFIALRIARSGLMALAPHVPEGS